jgi:hypothetical protein
MTKSISWRNLRGKQTYHHLEPKMLSGTVRKFLTTRPVPYKDFPHGDYIVSFDRDYAVNKIRRDLTYRLRSLPLQDVLDLVAEAYRLDRPDADNLSIHIEPHE